MTKVYNGILNSFFKKSFFYDKLNNLKTYENENIQVSAKKFKTDFKGLDHATITGYKDIVSKIGRLNMNDHIDYISNIVIQSDDLVSLDTNIIIERKVNHLSSNTKSSLDYLFPIPKDNTIYSYHIHEYYVQIGARVVHYNDYDSNIIDVYKVNDEYKITNGLHFQNKLTDEELVDELPLLKQKLNENKVLKLV